MSRRPNGFDEGVEREWTRFRRVLADRLAALADDEVVHLEVLTGADVDDLEGAAPYLQLLCWDGDALRCEASGNAVLDVRFALGPDHEATMLALGWAAPDEGEPSRGPHWSVDAELRDADEVAVLAVRTLREVFGCVHPSFVVGDLPGAGPGEAPPAPDHAGASDHTEAEDTPTFPHDSDQLEELVDRALAGHLRDGAVKNDDGDISIACGRALVGVRVLGDRPAVVIFADLVTDVPDEHALLRELDILNRSHPVATFYTREGAVRMRQVLPAMPFQPGLLRLFLDRLCGEVDDVAGDLLARVGGHPAREVHRTPAREEPDPDLVALYELMHADEVTPRQVAAVFGHDRRALVAQLVALRTGRQVSPEHDDAVVLELLRAGLRHLVDRQARADRRGVGAVVAVPQQLALLPDGDPDQAVLDLGPWERDVS